MIGFLYDVIEGWMEINQSVKYCDVLFLSGQQQVNKAKQCRTFFLENNALLKPSKNVC